MKICNTCNLSLPDTQFAIKRTRVDGTIQRNSICKSCHNDKAKIKYASMNKDHIYSRVRETKNKYRQQMYDFLSNKSCIDCGIDDIRVLEFDHIENKKFNIGAKVNSTPLKTLMEEIEKCEIVCANCHRIRTLTRQSSYRTRNYRY